MQNIENDTGQVRASSLPLQGMWPGRSMRRDHRRHRAGALAGGAGAKAQLCGTGNQAG